MRTVTCTLTLKDKSVITGTIKSISPQIDAQIIYTGATDRLPRRYAKGEPADLKFLFTTLARELDAALEIQEEGNFDVWAE